MLESDLVIAVVPDTEYPEITCAGDQTADTDTGLCTYTHSGAGWDATATDNCEVTSVIYILSGATTGTGTTLDEAIFNSGTTTVEWTATDTSGNTSNCSFTVNVEDNEAPLITCTSNQAVDTDDGVCTYQHPGTSWDATAIDNCGIFSIEYVLSGATTGYGSSLAGVLFNVGVTVVSWTTTDINGNTNNCSFEVVVTDSEPPVISGCPEEPIIVYTGPGRLTCDQVAAWTEPTATDNCTLAGSLVWTKTHTPGTTFPAGTTEVTYSVTDAGGNTYYCTFSVTVIDNTPPNFEPPLPITVYATSNCSTPGITPANTGSIQSATLWDNCTPAGSLQISYSDGAAEPGDCEGNRSITRTWTVTDQHGNTTQKTQLITIIDNTAPTITVPPNISISCSASTHPDHTGWATVTDNCTPAGNILLEWNDEVIPGSCPGRYTIRRTWRATDACGNLRIAANIQTINITDNTPPIITSPGEMTVTCPDDIPYVFQNVAEFIAAGGSVTDNCSAVSLQFISEVADGLGDKPGYCPTKVTRQYRFIDECGNYTNFSHVIHVASECGCSPCNTNVPFYWVDMLGDPAAHIVFENMERLGLCCGASNPSSCISFNVRLDPGAVGVEILIDGATPSPHDWNLDCEDAAMNNGIVCIQDSDYRLFTYCKPGGNKNNFSFRSLQGVVVSDDIQARVNCAGQFEAAGVVSNPVWTSVSPGPEGMYDHYLSSTTISNPMFYAIQTEEVPEVPPFVTYRVCGNIGSTLCTAAGIACAETTVYIDDALAIDLNIYFGGICEGEIPNITPDISPASSSYVIEWFSGHFTPGTPIHSGPSFTPPEEGLYSIKVTDIREGIPCSEAIHNFEIMFDRTGPTIQAPPEPLVIECNDSQFLQKITNWLNSASASYTDSQGNLITDVPENNYTGIEMICNTLVVTFNAFDHCNNENSATSTITIVDNTPPVFTFCPPAVTNQNDDNECLINELALEAPIATDDCGAVYLTWEKSGATNDSGTGTATGPFNVGITTITYTATDACGNTAVCVQEVTIIDVEPPSLTCPPDVIVTAAPPNCEMEVLVIEPPVIVENCTDLGITLSWEKSGATTATGSGDVNGTLFNVGTTIVTYTITDLAGNFDQCSFTVTVNDEVPPLVINCPDDATFYTDADSCEVWVDIAEPEVIDECGEIVTISHNSAYGINSEDASGNYPVGVHEITWTFNDASGNSSTCYQTVTVVDTIAPELVCQPSFEREADWGLDYAADVALDPPVYADNCEVEVLSWVMSGATTGSSPVSGINMLTVHNFNVGVTVITYSAADPSGNVSECSFEVTILARPVIECPSDNRSISTDTGVCHAALDPGEPSLLSGAQPITWYWVMSGATSASGTGKPIDPTPYTFNIGETAITWTATNVSGTDQCVQIIEVVDNEPPDFEAPADEINCVEDIFLAIYNPEGTYEENTDLTEPRPNYFLLTDGNSMLHLFGLSDNCTDPANLDISWTIHFAPPPVSGDPWYPAEVNEATITGTGQIDGPLYFPVGDNVITWTVTDESGNETTRSVTLTVTPRPHIIDNF